MHPGRDQTISISLRIGVYHPNTRTHGRLLGPCFKTGRISPVGRIMAAGHCGQCRLRRVPQPGARRATAGARGHMARRVAGPETILRRRGEKSPTPGQTDSLASNNFTYSFTFFPKFFSSFPHGTCSLSVSRKYLALEGHYLLISAAVPSNTTHDGRLLFGESRTARGCYPLRLAISTTNCTRLPAIAPRKVTRRPPKAAAFHIELVPLHSPLLGES